MPDDLLPHLIGPTPYSAWWLWTAVALTVALVLWYVGVFVLTRPGRRVPLVAAARDLTARRRAMRAIREIGHRYRAGSLAAAPAAAAASGEVRRFLHRMTGEPAEYMQLADVPASEIAPAATLLEDLVDVQFNAATELDVARVLSDAEELIRSWT
ncbi:hypothetical protein [Mycolicibacterium sp.]|uniref:hypothetical protein n=1 Tax=Mycolicibacterium sp. TaxID=2320850 RepID=UPI001A359C2E|nr:hypothetical protein [Mycolicibacterium sp.]MBJ7336874.1 hypothetical protein [Mycolicibacterium sp.]